MICGYFVLILAILPLSLLKVLIVVVLPIHDISKSDAIHLSENYVLDDRGYI